MLLLLPPSEGKTPAVAGEPLDLTNLSFTDGLLAARERMLATLIKTSSGQPTRALRTLKLSKNQAEELALNAQLSTAPTAPAAEIYSGVLFNALGLQTLSKAQLERAGTRILICSSLFGMVAPSDRIPAYRLSGDVTLPRLGKVSTFWRKHLAKAMATRKDELIVDFRSSTYVSFWPLPPELGSRAVTVKIWQQGSNGQRVAVSHFNKESKGKIARILATATKAPTTAEQLVKALGDWDAQLTDIPTRTGKPQQRLDITLP